MGHIGAVNPYPRYSCARAHVRHIPETRPYVPHLPQAPTWRAS
jgi:hypothetical protein